MKKRLILMLLVLVMLTVVSPLAAKGAPRKVTIAGPGLSAPMVVRDPDLLEGFAYYWFNDYERRIPARTNATGQGYTITRYVDETRAWDRLTYYPALDGGPGSVFFDGLVGPNMWTQGQGEWYEPRPEGDAAMVELLAQAGITITAQGYRLPATLHVLPPRAFQLHEPR